MEILDRLTSHSSRSLSVMIGHGQSDAERGRSALRGNPQGCVASAPAFLFPFLPLPLNPPR